LVSIRKLSIALSILASLALTACGGAPSGSAQPVATEAVENVAVQAADTPTIESAAPTSTVAAQAEAATATVESTPTAAEPVAAETVDWLSVEGKTDDDYTYRGNPDAAVTILDYSDFL
jgi:hypothetical protein